MLPKAKPSVTGATSSNFWDVLAQLDDSRALAAEREAEKAASQRREGDFDTEECRLPLRVLQEVTGRPIGFERINTLP